MLIKKKSPFISRTENFQSYRSVPGVTHIPSPPPQPLRRGGGRGAKWRGYSWRWLGPQPRLRLHWAPVHLDPGCPDSDSHFCFCPGVGGPAEGPGPISPLHQLEGCPPPLLPGRLPALPSALRPGQPEAAVGGILKDEGWGKLFALCCRDPCYWSVLTLQRVLVPPGGRVNNMREASLFSNL